MRFGIPAIAKGVGAERVTLTEVTRKDLERYLKRQPE